MRGKPLYFLGLIVMCAACGFALWRLWPEREFRMPDAKVSSIVKKAVERKVGNEAFETPYTTERLSEEHHRAPTPEEWPELTRILLEAPDGDMVESVKARFALHAGTRELAVLGDAYDTPVNDDTRQRIIDIFSVLQSADFMEAARQILTNDSLPITDHLVNACAVSLARRGELADVAAIFQRLNSAGEDPEPEGSLYSDTDGLMGAVSVVASPALEKFLCDAAAGGGAATTGRARAAAATALRNYHTVAVTEVLYGISNNEPDPLVRKRAAESLKSIQTNE